jgi:hypothetical protein
MTKPRKNFVVDVLLYVGFVLLSGTGLILQYILPHGSGRIQGSGIGRGAGQKVVIFLWGLTREQWGQIHFWIAVGILAVMLLHLILHWRWIICMLSRREQPSGVSGGRAMLGLAGLLGLLLLLIFPFLAPKETLTRNQIWEKESAQQSADTLETVKDELHEVETRDKTIRGKTTLSELQEQTGVPYRIVLKRLGLPEDISPQTKLGDLKRQYGFSIEDVRKIVKEYKP